MSSRLNVYDEESKIQLKRYRNHTFADETGDEYSASSFGDFAEYFARKKIKLQNNDSLLRQEGEEEGRPLVFKGVVATVNGYTRPGMQDLRAMIVKHGGVWMQYMGGKTGVTHIIAESLTLKKRAELERYRVVRPQWVVDSVKTGKLLPWHDYRVVEGGGSVRQSLLQMTPSQVAACNESPRKVLRLTQKKEGTFTYKSPAEKCDSIERLRTLKPRRNRNRSESEDSREKSSSGESGQGTRSQPFAVVIPVRRSGESTLIEESRDRKDERWVNENGEEASFAAESKILDGNGFDNFPSYQLPPPTSSPLIEPIVTPLRPRGDGREIPESSPPPVIIPQEKDSKTEDRYMRLSFGDSDFNLTPNLIASLEAFEKEAVLSTKNEKLTEEIKLAPSSHLISQPPLLSDGIAIAASSQTSQPLSRALHSDPEIVSAPTTPQKTAVQSPSDSLIFAAMSCQPSTWRPPLETTKKHPVLETPEIKSPPNKAKTAEEHNSALLANPRVRNSSVLNPNFLHQYYQESRLHHLSTWKAELKAKLQDLTANSQVANTKHKPLQKQSRRYIFHVDFDCFFAAVSIRAHHNPESIINKPIVVCHGPGGNSEVASCNYAARQYGVKNGMWMRQAQKLCPTIQILSYNFPAYEEASRAFYEVLLSLGADTVQSVSVDEALVDATTLVVNGTEGNMAEEIKHVDALARQIRDLIREKTKCEVSVGVGGNVLLAKLALRKAKPAGHFHLKSEHVMDFLEPLRYQDLPGIGYAIGSKLEEELRAKTVGEIRGVSKERLKTILGTKTGERVYNYARGIDNTEVGEVVLRKSVSADVNWGVRFETKEQAEQFLHDLAGELSKRLVAQSFKGKHLTLKVQKRAENAPLDPQKFLGHGECDIFNKSVILGASTNKQDIIGREAIGILKKFAFSPGELRGLGLQMTKLEPVKSDDGANSQKLLNFKPKSEMLLPGIKGKGKGKEEQSEEKSNSKNKTTELFQAPLSMSGIKKGHHSPTNIPFTLHTTPMPSPTQFVIPSQLDISVLDALPLSYRERILVEQKCQMKAKERQTEKQGDDEKMIENEKQKQHLSFKRQQEEEEDLPVPSQYDPEVWAAIPKEIQRQLLAEYQGIEAHVNRITNTSAGPSKTQPKQSILPQSPRRNRAISRNTKKTGPSPPKKKNITVKDNMTLTQAYGLPRVLFSQSHENEMTSNSEPPGLNGGASMDEDSCSPPPSPNYGLKQDVLNELPIHFREEALEEARLAYLEKHRQKKLEQQRDYPSVLQNGSKSITPIGVFNPHVARQQHQRAVEKRVVRLSPRPRKPAFQKLSDTDKIRRLIKDWYDACKEEGEGPHEDDVFVLGGYLKEVVVKEKDMQKARGLVRWLKLLVEEEEHSGDGNANAAWEEGWVAWKTAIERVMSCVQTAMKERGLGEMRF